MDDHLTFEENGLRDNHRVKAQRGGLRGGGKRPNNNPSASSNPAAGAKNRDEALTMIEEMVGTSMLRFQAHPNASPAVNAVVQRMTQIMNIARQKQIDMNQLLFQISQRKHQEVADRDDHFNQS